MHRENVLSASPLLSQDVNAPRAEPSVRDSAGNSRNKFFPTLRRGGGALDGKFTASVEGSIGVSFEKVGKESGER